MKRSYPTPYVLFTMAALLAAIGAFSVLSGCATMQPSGPGPAAAASAPATLDSQIATAIQEVTIARKAATSLLQGGQITVAKDQQIQANLDAVRAVLQSAQGLSPTDPAQAAQLLASALAQLATIQGAKQ